MAAEKRKPGAKPQLPTEGDTVPASGTSPKASGPETVKRGGSRASGSGSRAAGRKMGPDLTRDLREFAAAYADGWSHDDWTGLVGRLGERGHDTSDPDQLGMQLERERLRVKLESIEGLGPKRVQALIDSFDTLWSLRQAGVDEIASVPSIPRAAAERVRQSVA